MDRILIGALAFLAVACAGCSSSRPSINAVTALSATPTAQPEPTPVPTPVATAARRPLTTSSGFRLDPPAASSIGVQQIGGVGQADRGLQTVSAPKGMQVLSPVGWRSLPVASLSQQVCAGGSCMQVQEDVLVMAAPDGRESIAVFGVDVPGALPAGSLMLDDLVRGVVAGMSARAPATIADGPRPIQLPGADAASALRAVFTDPATGVHSTVFVEAASRGQQVGGVFVMAPDDYLQAHSDEVHRIRSSFRLATGSD